MPQIESMAPFPTTVLDPMYLAFTAKYLPALVAALRTLSRRTQPKAFAHTVQVLTLLPPCRENPYLRMFLESPQAAGLPTLLARALCDGVKWLAPSGPGYICHTLIDMVVWCAPAMGDDGKAAIDSAVRTRLAEKLVAMQQADGFAALSEFQRAEIQRLAGMLRYVEGAPEILASMREFHRGQVQGLESCAVCDKDTDLHLCSRCKTVKYCGQECQAKDWKDKHIVRCFTVPSAA